jgi:hypothetical protein
MPSPTSVETRALADISSRYVANHACPVWLGDRPDLLEPARLNFATASLVALGGRHLAITCHHVIDAFYQRRQAQSDAVFGIGGFSVDLDHDLLTSSKRLDLAVIDLSQYVAHDLIPRERFHQPAVWPTPPVSVGAFVFLGGFPGVWAEQPGLAHLRFNALTTISEVHSTADTHFVARVELEKCVTSGDPGLAFPNLGGLSGAPVFTWRALHADLVGFAYQYHQEFDLLLIRRSHVLDVSGAITLREL